VACSTVPRTDRSSAYFLVSSARQWLARRFLRRITHRLTSSFLPLISGSPDGSLIGLLPYTFRSSVARQTDRSSANFLFSSARQWLTGRIGHRLTSSFLPLISCLPASPDGALIGLLPRSFCSSVACPARQTDRLSAYFLVPSAHQWLAWLARRSAHQLTSSFLPLVSGLPDGLPDGSLIGLLPCSFRLSVARRMDRTSAYILVPSASQWLARRLAGRIALRLTSSFLPLVSGLTDGSSDGSLVGLLPRFFRSSVAHRMDRSSAYFLVPSTHQWLAGQLARWIALRLPSSFLPLVSSLPDGLPGGSLFGFLPCSFRSSVPCSACQTDCSSTYLLVSSARLWLAARIGHRLTSSFLAFISGLPGSLEGALIGLLPPSAHQWLAGWIAHRLTSSYLPLINGLLDGSPDGSLIGLLPRSFRSSVARQTDRSSAYFLVPSARQWLSRRLLGRIAHQLTSLFLPLTSGFPDSSADGLLIGLLPRPSTHQWLAGRIARQLTSSFLPLINGLPDGLPDGSLVGLPPRSFRLSAACPMDGLSRRSRRVLMAVPGINCGLPSPIVGFCW